MPHSPSFSELGLSGPLALAVERLGFQQPTPVQAACIPALLSGRDVLGEAQTGTGKTGAFGLPLIERVDAGERRVQALVLTPTRELANQVAAALGGFAEGIGGIDILPVYGGQPMGAQLRRLREGPKIVVGTPGRVVDHIKRGTLALEGLRLVVLDEADEMLRMGFIEDIEWILEQTPAERQTALFSATMPAPIRRIAHRHLREPEEIRIGAGNEAGADIDQGYCLVDGRHKLEALARLLEVEPDRDAAIVFARTKAATLEIADALAARGHAVSALNGDMEQKERERVVAELRDGRIDVIVATDVAARGIDVPRISHVFNYDAPGDAEAYVHRIGRTGRAGRKGRAILFLEPRRRRMLREIETLTRKPVRPLPVPDLEAVASSRQARFAGRIESLLASGHSQRHGELVDALLARCNASERDLAGALLALATELTPLLAPDHREPDPLAAAARESASPRARADARRNRGSAGDRGFDPGNRKRTDRRAPDEDRVRYYMPVGRRDGIGAREIVGALTHEGGLSGCDIGRIGLMDHYSHVDLPAALKDSAVRRLGRIHVAQRRLELTLETPELAGERIGVTGARSPAGAGSERHPARAPKPARAKGGEAPAKRKPRAWAGSGRTPGRGPAAAKPYAPRGGRNAAGTLAIRRKPA
ncbi:Cold-shock DEAD-box protein A [Thioalkalivibrio nitratireducens DSM 14787]|uniref:DEAD-box ATP-dependent RNA helicase RhpA n=1 Tax=Thioalkalivibrio nitratireducens (strain DSM 14787 / UNIQEM 213 / ALEN2) TaxID=1255043 RepID=L0E417_THIND|nr:DEAD/DEAH box helicase [Thioalkalivibrio nitratireducens]AGA35396.1 Cold-shock DEAD-box protein A [Thioalkalivibrio nitratireducens DSM 14787]